MFLQPNTAQNIHETRGRARELGPTFKAACEEGKEGRLDPTAAYEKCLPGPVSMTDRITGRRG